MIHIFDLDKTLWDTFDKHGNPIWAKQLIPPYRLDGDVVTDDVFSHCRLRKGVREYLRYLRANELQTGFVSVGLYHGLPMRKQPSIQLLGLFGIYEYFNFIKILKYKSFKKRNSLGRLKEKIIFYDDDSKNFAGLCAKRVTCVDSSRIYDWSQLIGKEK